MIDGPEHGLARRDDPETAKVAALSVEVADLERKVVEVLLRHNGGLTTHEIAECLRMQLVSISPRMKPLVKKNLVQDSGERRAGDSGRMSIVWKVVK